MRLLMSILVLFAVIVGFVYMCDANCAENIGVWLGDIFTQARALFGQIIDSAVNTAGESQ